MKKNILLILILSIFLQLYSQNKSKINLYLDENLEFISSESYNKKKQAYLFYSQKRQSDTLNTYILRERIKMGTLDSIENFQIRKLLQKYYEVDNTETLIIHFKKELRGYKEVRANSIPYIWYLPIGKDTIHQRITKRFYNKRKKLYDLAQKKCLKKNKKNQIQHLHLYKNNDGYTFYNEHFKWVKINRIINNFFFNDFSSVVVLKKNGEYLRYMEWYSDKVKKIIKTDDWSLIFKDYKRMLSTMTKNSVGFFDYHTGKKGYSFKVPKLANKEKLRQLSENNKLQNMSSNCYLIGY